MEVKHNQDGRALVEADAYGVWDLPILNSLLAIRISALGMMGGGRQNCSV